MVPTTSSTQPFLHVLDDYRKISRPISYTAPLISESLPAKIIKAEKNLPKNCPLTYLKCLKKSEKLDINKKVSKVIYHIAPSRNEEYISCLIRNQIKLRFTTPLLLLPSRIIDEEDFLNHPIFKNTKEKKEVFRKLIEIAESLSFNKTYEDFLSSLKSDNWVESCRKNHVTYAYLSIIAYFNGDIDQEEMFVIHAVCTAYNDLEAHSNKPETSVRVVQVEPKVISPEDISEYLTQGNFPPFAENIPENMLTNRVSDQELENVKADFIIKFAKMRPVKRTFLEYTLSPIRFATGASFEAYSHFTLCIKTGLIYNENKLKVILPPIGLAIDLFRAASHFNKDAKFNFMFGHKNDYKLLDGQRPVTIASLLFETPPPHGYTAGSKRLSMIFHDLVHILLEFNNPHLKLMIKLGNRLLDANKSLPDNLGPKVLKCFRQFAGDILDRGTTQHRYDKPKEAFWKFLSSMLEELKLQISEIPENRGNPVFDFCFLNYMENIFLPTLQSTLKSTDLDASKYSFLDIEDLIP